MPRPPQVPEPATEMDEIEVSRDELRVLAAEQAALRRLAN